MISIELSVSFHESYGSTSIWWAPCHVILPHLLLRDSLLYLNIAILEREGRVKGVRVRTQLHYNKLRAKIP